MLEKVKGKVYVIEGLILNRAFKLHYVNLESIEEAREVAEFYLGQSHQNYIISSIKEFNTGQFYSPAI